MLNIIKKLKFNIILVFILVIFFSKINADNEITYFKGGKHLCNIRFYSSILMGVGARNRNYGNSISSLINCPGIVSSNPAGLAFQKKSGISLDFAPDFNLDISDIYSDFHKTINDNIDDAIKDMRAEGMEPTYPDIKAEVGQIGGFNGFAASFINNKFGNFGISFQQPLILDFNLISNEISVTITDSTLKNEGLSDEYVERTTIPLGIELFDKMQVRFNQIDLGYGKKITNNLSFGCGVEFLTCDFKSEIIAVIDGIIRQTGGGTDINVAFNDPNVSYRNTLNDTININFNKTFLVANLALSYRPNKHIYLDASYSPPKEGSLQGNLKIVQHKLGAIDLNYDEDAGEELFDIEKLKPSQITYTNRTIYESDVLDISYPGRLAISLSFLTGKFSSIISYEKPLENLSFHYECDVYEDGIKKVDGEFINYADTTRDSYTIGLRLNHNLKLALSYGSFALSGQLILAEQKTEGLKKEEEEESNKKIILGSAGVGFGFKLLENLAIDLNLISLPAPILRTTLTYCF